jgi:hypothetical protein
MTYIPAVTANVSVANSTTGPLVAAGVFHGTPEDVSQYASLSVSYYVQPPTATGNIIVQFSNTNSDSNWTPISNTVTQVTSLSANGFTLDTTMTCQFFRVLYVNDSTPQTKFVISSIFHPQARIAIKTTRAAELMTDFTDTINTRSMLMGKTQGGGLYEQVATNGENSLTVTVTDPRTAFGEVSVMENFPIAQVDFVYGINTTVTSNVLYGGNASVGVTSGLLKVTAGTNSMAMFRPKKFLKYRSGESTLTRLTAAFTSGGPSSSVQFGGIGFLEPASNVIIDGMGFGYSGTTFGVFWARNSVLGFTPQSSWNVDKLQGSGASGMTIDPTAINIFQLKFQYLGAGNLFYYVMNGLTGRWVLVHNQQNAGKLTTPVFRDPTMHGMWYANCYTTGTVTVSGGSCGQFLEGRRRFLGPKGAYTYAPTASVTNNTNTQMFALHNASYFNGIPNRSQAHLRSISFGGNGSGSGSNQPNGVICVTLVRNPSSGGPTVFTPYNGSLGTNFGTVTGSNIIGQSTMSTNVSQLTTLTGGNLGFAHTIAIGGQSGTIDVTDYEIVLNPGDTLCFMANVVTASGTCYIGSAAFWVEDL